MSTYQAVAESAPAAVQYSHSGSASPPKAFMAAFISRWHAAIRRAWDSVGSLPAYSSCARVQSMNPSLPLSCRPTAKYPPELSGTATPSMPYRSFSSSGRASQPSTVKQVVLPSRIQARQYGPISCLPPHEAMAIDTVRSKYTYLSIRIVITILNSLFLIHCSIWHLNASENSIYIQPSLYLVQPYILVVEMKSTI